MTTLTVPPKQADNVSLYSALIKVFKYSKHRRLGAPIKKEENDNYVKEKIFKVIQGSE